MSHWPLKSQKVKNILFHTDECYYYLVTTHKLDE